MKVRIFSNGQEAPLSRFIGSYLGNVCLGIASSLKVPRPIRSLEYTIEGEEVRIDVNGEPVPLNMSRGFCRVIIMDTIRGMVRHLKLADPSGMIRIEMNLEEEP